MIPSTIVVALGSKVRNIFFFQWQTARYVPPYSVRVAQYLIFGHTAHSELRKLAIFTSIKIIKEHTK